ncbi:MAG: anti-sigma factor [Marmoricola sp.]
MSATTGDDPYPTPNPRDDQDGLGRSGSARSGLQVPAGSSYVGVLRITAAGLAAQAELTVEDIEDLRMAIGEACALLLDCGGGETMSADFELTPGSITVTIAVDAAGEPDRDSFGWQVLRTIAASASAETSPDSRAIRFTIVGERV